MSSSNWTTSRDWEAERAELKAALESKLFSRAPSMVQFLNYICSKYFEGEASQIKEYTIAVEAFGRSPDFQQKEDPIVRVEANRLRKRLKQYYETEGRDHAIQISIPSGQYQPVFLSREEVTASEPTLAGSADFDDSSLATVTHSPPLEEALTLKGVVGLEEAYGIDSAVPVARREYPAPSPKRIRRFWLATGVIAVLAVAFASWWLGGRQSRYPAEPASIQAPQQESAAGGSGPSAGLVPQDEVRILAGATASKYVDRLGQVWSGDRFFRGGSTFKLLVLPIQRTTEPEIYQSGREGDFQYDIPLKPGVYELRLHFAELIYGPDEVEGGGETSRLINVRANGNFLVESFDVFADAGGSRTADVKVFTDISPVDGILSLTINAYRSRGLLNAIEVLQGIPGQMRPLRMTTRQSAYFGKNQTMWAPDNYFRGGRVNARTNPIAGTTEPELYQCERFGNFSYSIPVATGRYKLTLKFAETYFGQNNPGKGGVGSRVFDISCNGEPLLRNFDIFKEAGGENRAVDKTFRGLEASAQGKLLLTFVPVQNYASVSAIEVVPEPSSRARQ
jgi:hypothetical protein